MIYKTIMVQLDVDGSSTARMSFAWELAQRFKADLIAFAAAEARMVVPAGDSGIVAADVMRRQIEEIEDRLTVLKEECGSVTQDSNRASWRGFVGNPTRLLAEHARATDLVVVGTPGTDLAVDHLRPIDVGMLVLSAGRPVLLASESLAPVRTDTILVAWKETREARRAVVDAMPFLVDARDVLVATLEVDDSKAAHAGVADVVRFLMKHGVKARSEVVGVGRSDGGEALAEIARGIGADLIISGGYGHSRLREWAFGGVTRSLLRNGAINRLISN